MRANAEVFYLLRKEAPEMCEALVELMEPVIAEKVEERVKEKIKEREE